MSVKGRRSRPVEGRLRCGGQTILPLPGYLPALRTYHLFLWEGHVRGGTRVDSLTLASIRIPRHRLGEHAGEIGSGSARRVAPMSIPPAVSASVWSPVGLPLTGNDQIAPVTRAASTTKTTPDLISHRPVVIVSRAILFMIAMAFHQRLPGCHADRHALAAPRAVQRLRGHIGYAGFVQDADRIDWHRLAALTRLAGPTDSFTMVVTN